MYFTSISALICLKITPQALKTSRFQTEAHLGTPSSYPSSTPFCLARPCLAAKPALEEVRMEGQGHRRLNAGKERPVALNWVSAAIFQMCCNPLTLCVLSFSSSAPSTAHLPLYTAPTTPPLPPHSCPTLTRCIHSCLFTG